MRRAMLVLVLAVLGGLVAACGSDDDGAAPDATTTTAGSPETEVTATVPDGGDGLVAAEPGDVPLGEWAQTADEACEDVNLALAELPDPTSAEVITEVGPEYLSILRTHYEELIELGMPDDLAPEAATYLDLLAQQIVLAEQWVAAAATDDQDAALEVVAEGQAIDDRMTELAGQLGFEVCTVQDPGAEVGDSEE